jgi:hypothetical protein
MMAKQKTESEVSAELKERLLTEPLPEPTFVVDRTVDIKATGTIKGEVRIKAPPGPPMLEPHEWAEKLGHIVRGNPNLPQSQTFPSAAHAVADKLHGWSAHRHHYQTKPLLITREAYEAALEAGGAYPVTPAHEPALSPVKRPKVK